MKKKSKEKLSQSKKGKGSVGCLNKQVNSVIKNNAVVLKNSGVQGKGSKVLKIDNGAKLLTILSVISFLLIAVVVCQFFILESEDPSTVLNNGTMINGVNVGGLSPYEAEQVIYEVFKKKKDEFSLTLNYLDKTWSFNSADFKVNSEIHTIIEEAESRNQLLNSYNNQTEKLNQLKQEGVSISVAFNYIFVGLDDKIEKIIKEIEVEPINSEIKFNPNNKNPFSITEHKNGLRVDKEKLYYDINEQFNKTNSVVVEIKTFEEKPEITKEDNENSTKQISSFTTHVADSTGNRKLNVIKAINMFNGKIIMPGEEVSFNKVTGPHTTENGYKVATVIYNGQFVDGVGGGVCQASTTLYNAVLCADVEILEVHKHTLPVKYVPLGLDAMVSEYVADLRFKNNHDFPIYIKTVTDSESVKVIVYGKPLENQIKTRSELIKTLPSLPDKIMYDENKEYTDKVLFKGEKYRLTYAREGYEVKCYLERYNNNEKISEELIRHEIYQPQSGIIVEGVEDVLAGMNIIESAVNNNVNIMQDDMNNNSNNSLIPTSVCP